MPPVELFNRTARETRDEVILLAEERFRRHLSEELRRVESRFGDEIITVRQEMARMEVRLIRWMFGFWATHMAAVIALFVTIVRFLSY